MGHLLVLEESEAVVVGDVAPAAARRRVLVALLAAAPPPLPVCAAGVGPAATVVPPVHDDPALVAPLAVDPLVRRRQREQPLLACKTRPRSNGHQSRRIALIDPS